MNEQSRPLGWFRGAPNVGPSAVPAELPRIEASSLDDPRFYECEPGLVHAINVAILLGQPLLLCGEVGSGKTAFARRLAWELGLARFDFFAKSDSRAQDLFYQFDAVARFHDSQHRPASSDLDPLAYVAFGALGKAIILGLGLAAARPYFAGRAAPDWLAARPTPQSSVVLIDEIDKAPRDFPNDLLNEIESSTFYVREAKDLLIGVPPLREAPRARPIIVITSNSERQLPDPFLRRCVFYSLAPVDRSRLERITTNRLKAVADLESSPFLKQAIEIFFHFRSPNSPISRPPSTSEFVAWLYAMLRLGADPASPIPGVMADRTVAVLAKSAQDLQMMLEAIKARA